MNKKDRITRIAFVAEEGFNYFIFIFVTSTMLGSGWILARIQANGGLSIFGVSLYAQQFLSILSLVVMITLIIYMRAVIAPLKKVDAPSSEQKENIDT